MTSPSGDSSGAALVGRDRELDALRGWLDHARAGRGRLVLCSGEAGIGKTRLAQELAAAAGAAAGDVAVAWGRCVDTEGAPPFWPWVQVLRDLRVDDVPVRTGGTPQDRFRAVEAVSASVLAEAARRPLLLVLDDLHWCDEASLLVLRHLADRAAGAPLLMLATLRDAEPAGALGRALPDLHHAADVEVLRLGGLTPADVARQLDALGADAPAVAVHDATGGNPYFVREVARAVVEGTWRPDRPPRTVRVAVGARVDRLTGQAQQLVRAGAVVGRRFSLAVVADMLDVSTRESLGLADEAVASGLVALVGGGELRFAHALTRDAVRASIPPSALVSLHRGAADALEVHWAGELDDHLAELAWHRLAIAPYGEAAPARDWALRAAAEAVRRLGFEEGVRLYQAALGVTARWPDVATHCRTTLLLGRAAYLAGDLDTALSAVVAAADLARSADLADLVAEAALVVEPVPDPSVAAVIAELCEEALARADPERAAGLRARLLAVRSTLAFYVGDHELARRTSVAALDLARSTDDDEALVAALRAHHDACPGPDRRPERLVLAAEMLSAARRTGDAGTAMWGRLWRIDALVEDGDIAGAAAELAPLGAAVARVGGPVSGWHLDRVRACVAQAQGRFADAQEAAARGFERMRPIEPSPATGVFLGTQWALARHVGTSDDALTLARTWVEPPPQFRTMGRVSRAYLLLRAGFEDEAAGQFRQAGAPESWSWPPFFVAPGAVLATLVAIGLGHADGLVAALADLEPFRGQHVVGSGVSYCGPAEVTLGLGALAQGRLDDAVDDLEVAVRLCDRSGVPAYLAEATHHLATALAARGAPGDRERARRLAAESDGLVRSLGMTAFTAASAELVRRLGPGDGVLSVREAEVARLVADGLTNRQIAGRLVISDRTVDNHVAHILTKLGFTSRSQVAAWCASGMSSRMGGLTHVERRPSP